MAVAARTAVNPNPTPVTVTITPGDPKTNTKPAVDTGRARVSLNQDQEVRWQCTDPTQPFKIIFKGNSPFHDRVFHSNGKNHSGRPRPDVAPNSELPYLYTVICNGELDPDVIVEN
jgi:hypothetical protein